MFRNLTVLGAFVIALQWTTAAGLAATMQVQGFACDVEDPGGATAKFVHQGQGQFPLVVKITNPSCLAGALFPQGVSGKPATSLGFYFTPVSATGTFYPLLKYNYQGSQQTVSLGFTAFTSLPKAGKQMNYNMKDFGVPNGATINQLVIYVSEYSGNANGKIDNFSVNGTAITNKVLAEAACPNF